MKTIKTTLLAALLLFTVNAALAQEKYEYATITFIPSLKDIGISINGTEYKKIEVSKDEIKSDYDTNAALKQVSKMSSDGWDLFNTSSSHGTSYNNYIYVFYLRKKVS